MKPILLTVDDDPHVLIAIEHDLKRRFGNRFRIRQSNSGQKGLDLVNQLKLRNELVALFVVDQMMPEMTGVEFLQTRQGCVSRCKVYPTYTVWRYRSRYEVH